MHECIFGKQFFIVVLCGFIDIPAAKSKCSTFWSKKKSSITEQSCHRNNIKYMNAVAHKHPHIKIHDCYWVDIIIDLVFHVLYADCIRLEIHADIKKWSNNLPSHRGASVT